MKLPKNVITILKASKSNGTWTQYKSSLKRWITFCESKKWCPREKNLVHYLEFLSNLFELGLSYSAINTARSTLSTVFGKIEGVSLGEHRLIVDLMKGISRLRPVVPRYTFTWNPDLVLRFLKSLGTDQGSLKDLSLKLVGLLALCTGQRVQTLASIRIDEIHWGNPVQIVVS